LKLVIRDWTLQKNKAIVFINYAGFLFSLSCAVSGELPTVKYQLFGLALFYVGDIVFVKYVDVIPFITQGFANQ
jgi:hypothetical protein